MSSDKLWVEREREAKASAASTEADLTRQKEILKQVIRRDWLSSTPDALPAAEIAAGLHSDTPYGDTLALEAGKSYKLTMADQVNLTAYLIYQATGDSELVKAAFLHKSWEPSKTKGQTPLPVGDLRGGGYSDRVVDIVTTLAAEPETQDSKATWIASFSSDVTQIFLAEKAANFIVSGAAPSARKDTTWHQNYVASRGAEIVHCPKYSTVAAVGTLREIAMKEHTATMGILVSKARGAGK